MLTKMLRWSRLFAVDMNSPQFYCSDVLWPSSI